MSAVSWNRTLSSLLLSTVLFSPSLHGNPCGKIRDQSAIDYLGHDLEKNEFRLSDFQGRPLVVSFWATWCKPCMKELPMLEGLQRHAGPEMLQVVAVNFREEQYRFRKFLRQWDVDLEMIVVRDSKGAARKTFGVKAIPATFVFDSEGKLTTSHCGYSTEGFDQLLASLNNLIFGVDDGENDAETVNTLGEDGDAKVGGEGGRR